MKYISLLFAICFIMLIYLAYFDIKNQEIAYHKEYLNNYSLERNSRLIARVLYAEGNGESDIDKIAIGSSILNRINSIEFPSSIDSVIYQKNQYVIANKFTEHDLQIAICLLEDHFRDCNIMYFFNPKTANKSHIKYIKNNKILLIKTTNHEYY